MFCLCGLNHHRPLPKVFKASPIILASSSSSSTWHCHVCGSSSAEHRTLRRKRWCSYRYNTRTNRRRAEKEFNQRGVW